MEYAENPKKSRQNFKFYVMAVWIVKATIKTTVSLATSTVNIPEGYSVKVNSPWPFNWDEFRTSLERDLGGKVVAFSNDSTWKWDQM